MKKELNFNFPLWEYGELGFYNCYASVYLCMESTTLERNHKCVLKDGINCDHCGNCSISMLNNIFETMAGQTIIRQSWSGEKTKMQIELIENFGDNGNPSDELVDFIIGFTGYNIKK